MSQAVLATETNRRQLQEIIAGLSDGVILLEIDQTILWANEAALAMHGVADIAGLGANAEEYRQRFALRYRNNHPLTADQYPISRVAGGDTFSDVVVEVTDGDERAWVHRVRSMVLTDRNGDAESLVLILADATEWASAEQRFEKTFNANPAPAVICRLNDLRYIKVNQGFLEMTGYSREQVIGRSVYEVDVLEDAERKDLAIERLNQGSTIPQMQAELKLPDGGSKLVIVAGQPLDINGEDCMLFSFMDLEPRRKAEVALRQSEERFAKAFRLTPVPTLVCSADRQHVVEVNEAFLDTTGFTSEEVIGRSVAEIGFIEGTSTCQQLFGTLEAAGNLHGMDVQVRKKGAELIDCVLSADTCTIQGVACYLLVLMNITERKRSELELVSAIEEVMRDASWFSQTLIEKLANVKSANASNHPATAFTDLTVREREVLGLICEGLADKEIAGRLGLAPNTIRNHVATVYSKLAVHSRSEAIVWARERGLFAGERRVGR
ncbi:MAG: helix-turn-helix transcriptional regulator [Pseudomonas sp.]|uniref:helix-turn-helix transcriptional regulator n=1 Tax=Pseudomonas abieticivorans TaxID=2931382 RepID=UPI0020BD66B1|nr:helix-turn-helix transcriptional regulator [Pseudomonas sp. PIA16]MDE1166686.1 helix-turn-helix transcriptional regulator [Pseudomonas sp.]